MLSPSFVSYATRRVEKAPPGTVLVGPSDPAGNKWFPQDHFSLAIPIKNARRIVEDLKNAFVAKKSVAYPEQRLETQS
jgi:hypothetical protein